MKNFNEKKLQLSKNHDVQTRLREEIEHHLLLHNGRLSYDFVEEMPYLDMVINGIFFSSL